MRSFYVMKEIAKRHTVWVVTTHAVDDFTTDHRPVFPKNVNVVSHHNKLNYQSVFNQLPTKLADAINYRILTKSLSGKTNSYLLQAYPSFINALNEVNPGIIIYENLEAMAFFRHSQKNICLWQSKFMMRIMWILNYGCKEQKRKKIAALKCMLPML